MPPFVSMTYVINTTTPSGGTNKLGVVVQTDSVTNILRHIERKGMKRNISINFQYIFNKTVLNTKVTLITKHSLVKSLPLHKIKVNAYNTINNR